MSGFDELYLWREREKKSNFENFFTETIVFMSDVSDLFKECFLNFLSIKCDNLKEIQFWTHKPTKSRNKNKKKEFPDLAIYRNGKIETICEIKVDSEPTKKQINDYHNAFKRKAKNFRLIAPEDYLSRCDNFKFKPLKWEDFFLKLNKEVLNGEFFKTNSLDFTNNENSVEKRLIYQFLSLMQSRYMEAINKNILEYKYNGSFQNFCTLIKNALEFYNSYSNRLQEKYGGGKSEIDMFVMKEIIQVGKTNGKEGKCWHGILLKGDGQLLNFRHEKKKGKDKPKEHRFRVSQDEMKKNIEVLYDLRKILNILLSDKWKSYTDLKLKYKDKETLIVEYYLESGVKRNMEAEIHNKEIGLYFSKDNKKSLRDFDFTKILTRKRNTK